MISPSPQRFFVPPTETFKHRCGDHADNVEGVAWLDNRSDVFLSCSLDGCIRLFEASTGKLKDTVVEGQQGGIYSMNVINNGYNVLAGMGRRENNIALFDIRGKKNHAIQE